MVMKTICGIDCRECTHKDNCKGCVETNGHPLGGECVAARCYQSGGEKCFLQYKKEVLDEVNSLQIKDTACNNTFSAKRGLCEFGIYTSKWG